MKTEAARLCGCTQEEPESCVCGGFCPCHGADPRERHQCCGRVVRSWPFDRCMCVQPAKRVSIERPVCDCGGFAILGGLCADCHKAFKNGDRIPCRDCGIPIPQPGQHPNPAALLCDECYEKVP